MTDSQSPSSSDASLKPFGLILIAAAALVVFLLMLRQWQTVTPEPSVIATAPADSAPQLEMSRRLTQAGISGTAPERPTRSPVLPLLAFTLALGAGACVGRFWPRHNVSDARDTSPTADAVTADTGDTQTESNDSIEDTAPNDDAGAVNATPPSLAIDELPLDEALAAKDEVIESLENIVKENRDRWSNFELERDDLKEKVRNLQAELRIASDIIEGMHGDGDAPVFDPPQILSRA